MKVLIVYESMYGNTRAIADAIGEGLRVTEEVDVVHVSNATPEMVKAAGLLVVGAPTHVHGLPSRRTRVAAADAAKKSALHVEPSAAELGVREWIATQPSGVGKSAAAFDTRMPGPPLLTGRASLSIAKRLRRAGHVLIVEPASFVVSKENHLVEGALADARDWGRSIGRELRLVARPPHTAPSAR